MAAMINQKVVLLEAHVEAKVNEVRQGTTSLLEELKATVVVVRESQEKMGRAMERMSNELQELVQRDAGTEGEEETYLLPQIDRLLDRLGQAIDLPAYSCVETLVCALSHQDTETHSTKGFTAVPDHSTFYSSTTCIQIRSMSFQCH